MSKIIDDSAVKIRTAWIDKLNNVNKNFADGLTVIDNDLSSEINSLGIKTLIDHLRLCGNIPEAYDHDSSEEKLYSKYTDTLLSHAFKKIGLNSIVLTERADVADVEAYAKNYSFVADAKAFRLSRTAKNQKDFKVQAMDRWKHGKPYAMVVCPIYQLPRSSSQIYHQATSRNVCIFTYSHLSLLVNYSVILSESKAENLLYDIFKTIEALNPSKNANDYWLAVNRTIINNSDDIKELWNIEKKASVESINIAKEEGLTYLANERAKIMKLSHADALKELIKLSKIDSKIRIINSISDNGLFGLV